MSKKLILTLAMALVLVSGAFMNSHAANLGGPYFRTPACWSFACGLSGPHSANSIASATQAPSQMGAVGY